MKLDGATEVAIDTATEPALDTLSECPLLWRTGRHYSVQHRCNRTGKHQHHRCRCGERLQLGTAHG